MSATAEFIQLPANRVEQLRSDYDDTTASGRPVAEYDYSGYVLGVVLPYLSTRGIELGRSSYDALVDDLCQEHEISLFVLTPTHRDAFLTRLSSEQFPAAELLAFYNKFNACVEGPEVAEAMLVGVKAIQSSLASLDDDSVVMCIIG